MQAVKQLSVGKNTFKEIINFVFKQNILWTCFFILLTLFFMTTPLVADDYTFLASWRSVDNISSFVGMNIYFYENVNGRVFGNMLSLLFASDRLFSSLFRAAVMTAIVILATRVLNVSSLMGKITVAAIIIFVPVHIFSETIAWRAGFYNYTVPLLLLLGIYVSFINYRDNLNSFNLALITFLGVIVSLFVENVTIALASIALLLLTLALYKKNNTVLKPSIALLLGSLMGLLIMFGSPIYHKVASGDDYRTIGGTSKGGILDIARVNASEIVDTVLLQTWPLMAAFLIIALVCTIRQAKRKQFKTLSFIAVSFFSAFSWLAVSKYLVYPDNINTSLGILLSILTLVAAAIFYISFIVLAATIIKDKTIRIRIILVLVFSLILVAPLLAVEPLSPRVFYIVYVLQALVCFDILMYIYRTSAIHCTIDGEKKLALVFYSVFIIVTIGIFSIYGASRFREIQNDSLAKPQINAGKNTIYLKSYPFNKFLHSGKYKSKWPRMYYGNCKCSYRSCNQCPKLDIVYR